VGATGPLVAPGAGGGIRVLVWWCLRALGASGGIETSCIGFLSGFYDSEDGKGGGAGGTWWIYSHTQTNHQLKSNQLASM
jgi:hypothetical protein